jgi:hypothetical protein
MIYHNTKTPRAAYEFEVDNWSIKIAAYNIMVFLALITHKYRGSRVAFSISKTVEPNEEIKVG